MFIKEEERKGNKKQNKCERAEERKEKETEEIVDRKLRIKTQRKMMGLAVI